jgi:drug/metabolite transporter (DMT)-like permease
MPVERRALAAVCVAVVLWSGCSLFVRAGDTDALVFTTWRLWLSLVPLSAIVWFRSRGADATPFKPVDITTGHWLLVLFGAGAFFVSGAATAFAALQMTTLLNVTLIGALSPVLVIAFAVVFLGERVKSAHALQGTIAIVATVVVAFAASGGGTWSLAGDLVAVVSLFLNSGWFLYGRIVRTNLTVDPFALMLGTMVTGAVILTPITLVVHGSLEISGKGLFYAVCVMVAGTSAHIFMIWAHRYVPTTISSPLLLAEPPLVAAGAWLWFGESLNAVEILGSAVVVASLWGLVRSSDLEQVEHDVPDPAAPT